MLLHLSDLYFYGESNRYSIAARNAQTLGGKPIYRFFRDPLKSNTSTCSITHAQIFYFLYLNNIEI